MNNQTLDKLTLHIRIDDPELAADLELINSDINTLEDEFESEHDLTVEDCLTVSVRDIRMFREKVTDAEIDHTRQKLTVLDRLEVMFPALTEDVTRQKEFADAEYQRIRRANHIALLDADEITKARLNKQTADAKGCLDRTRSSLGNIRSAQESISRVRTLLTNNLEDLVRRLAGLSPIDRSPKPVVFDAEETSRRADALRAQEGMAASQA